MAIHLIMLMFNAEFLALVRICRRSASANWLDQIFIFGITRLRESWQALETPRRA